MTALEGIGYIYSDINYLNLTFILRLCELLFRTTMPYKVYTLWGKSSYKDV